MKATIETKIGNNGRFVIPRKIREQLDLKEGDRVQVAVEDGKVVIYTRETLLEEFYELSKNVRASGVDVVQELIDERHQEAESE